MIFNKIIGILSTFVKRTLYCFALIVLGMTLVGFVAGTDETMHYLSSAQMLTFFLFSVLFAVSFFFADFEKKNVIIKRAIQFVLSYASLVAVFLCGGNFENYVEANGVQNPAFSVLSISFMFVVIYCVCGLLVLVSKFVASKIENSSKDYESMFDKKN